MTKTAFILILCSMMQDSACQSPGSQIETDPFRMDNLVAWCIVPFDAANRSPEARAEMLSDLGFSQMAYDYRDEHIPSFKEEIEELREHRIKLSAVWLWMDPKEGEYLSPSNQSILKTLEETNSKTELWVSFPAHVFKDLSDEESLKKAILVLGGVLTWVEKNGCTIALYNHGDWFGEPQNQIRIIEALGSEKIKIVYNFHHGHHQVEGFENLLQSMLPYLSAININGMKVEGPKIITLGDGDRELEMLGFIKASGFRGPVGIIGHTEGEDIKQVLERNLKGLKTLNSQL